MLELPAVPRGKELEDFVAALLQATGHFVEKNIEEERVLELDIVATRYDANPQPRVFEVKEGAPLFRDIFKVLGWMTYLNIPEGAFVTARPPEGESPEFFAERSEQVGMKFVLIDDLANAAEVFADCGFGRADPVLHHLWRYSMWLERNFLAWLRALARTRPEMVAPREAINYYRLINNGVFLARDPVDRVLKLYAAYQAHPRLTLGAARELSGGTFDPVTAGEEALLGDALRFGRHALIHTCMYLEHRARLSILKAAVDCLRSGYEFVERLGQ